MERAPLDVHEGVYIYIYICKNTCMYSCSFFNQMGAYVLHLHMHTYIEYMNV